MNPMHYQCLNEDCELRVRTITWLDSRQNDSVLREFWGTFWKEEILDMWISKPSEKKTWALGWRKQQLVVDTVMTSPWLQSKLDLRGCTHYKGWKTLDSQKPSRLEVKGSMLCWAGCGNKVGQSRRVRIRTWYSRLRPIHWKSSSPGRDNRILRFLADAWVIWGDSNLLTVQDSKYK